MLGSELIGGDEFAELETDHERLPKATVRVRGEKATVAVPNASVYLLQRAGGRWYIADSEADAGFLPTADELEECFWNHGVEAVEAKSIAEPGGRSPVVMSRDRSGKAFGVLLRNNAFIRGSLATPTTGRYSDYPPFWG